MGISEVTINTYDGTGRQVGHMNSEQSSTRWGKIQLAAEESGGVSFWIDDATFELNELLVSEQFNHIDKHQLSSRLLSLKEYMDVTGVPFSDLNLYNAIGNPNAVLKEHSLAS